MPSEPVRAAELIQRLCAGSSEPAAAVRVVLVAAHPDDETIGAASRLPRIRHHLTIVCLTDGSPRHGQDALNAGFCSRAAYARARRLELGRALALADVAMGRVHFLGYPDQESCLHLQDIVQTLEGILDAIRPDLILTHAYEGGHPDHDSAAFAVSFPAKIFGIPVVEFSSYNAGPQGGGWMLDFLPEKNCRVTLVALSDEERSLKRRMMEAYASQKWILDVFPDDVERFRPAPEYDFGKAPHQGALHYEKFDWGIDGAVWRRLAREAALQRRMR